MCTNHLYTERGIKELHGFGAEEWRIEAEYAVPVPGELGELGVLLEPTSVVAKAWDHIDHVPARSPVVPRPALVTGPGPLGPLPAPPPPPRGARKRRVQGKRGT